MEFSPFQNQDSPNEVNAPKPHPAGQQPNPFGRPFRRYIGRDEVQKRATSMGGANMFSRPPVTAPVPGQPAPVPAVSVQPHQGGGFMGGASPAPIQTLPGMPSNQGLRAPMPANPGLRAPMTGYTGGGGGTVQPPQVQPPMATVAPGNTMPVVRPGSVQFSLANRGWGA